MLQYFYFSSHGYCSVYCSVSYEHLCNVISLQNVMRRKFKKKINNYLSRPYFSARLHVATIELGSTGMFFRPEQ